MFACTFALAFPGAVVGLGDAVTVVVELALALLLEFSAVLQEAPKTPKASKVRNQSFVAYQFLLRASHFKCFGRE
jgi:hypothetical protein